MLGHKGGVLLEGDTAQGQGLGVKTAWMCWGVSLANSTMCKRAHYQYVDQPVSAMTICPAYDFR